MATTEVTVKNPCLYIRKSRYTLFSELVELLKDPKRKLSLADLFNAILPTLVHALKTSEHPHIIKLEGVVRIK